MAHPRTLAKIAARIQERAAHCLAFEVKDPRASFVTITRVEVSKDISSAKIFYSVLGGRGERTKMEFLLSSATGFIQVKVARVLNLRRVPRLSWVYDESVEHAAHMDRVIREALERDRQIHERGQPGTDPSQPREEWQEEYEGFADEPDGQVR